MSEIDRHIAERNELWVEATHDRTEKTHPELWDEYEQINSSISEINALRADLNRLQTFYENERARVIHQLGVVSVELPTNQL